MTHEDLVLSLKDVQLLLQFNDAVFFIIKAAEGTTGVRIVLLDELVDGALELI